MSVRLCLPVAVLLACGCVDTSPDRVKLTAEVQEVDLTIDAGVLVGAVTGSFDLVLSVGDLSGESVTVEAPTVDLVLAESRESLLRLDALAPGVQFPLSIGEGDTRTLPFELTDENTFDPDTRASYCAGPLRLSVTYRDSLSDRPSLVESSPVTPAGCP